MARSQIIAVLCAAVVGGVVVLALGGSPAQAESPRVLCTQIPQKSGQLDEQYVADFMGEQLTAGRNRFTTVSGISTVMCAF